MREFRLRATRFASLRDSPSTPIQSFLNRFRVIAARPFLLAVRLPPRLRRSTAGSTACISPFRSSSTGHLGKSRTYSPRCRRHIPRKRRRIKAQSETLVIPPTILLHRATQAPAPAIPDNSGRASTRCIPFAKFPYGTMFWGARALRLARRYGRRRTRSYWPRSPLPGIPPRAGYNQTSSIPRSPPSRISRSCRRSTFLLRQIATSSWHS